jgi:hypothetical protein
MQTLKTCEICGNKFVAEKRNIRYCSKACGVEGKKKRDKERQAERVEEAAREKAEKAKKMPIWQLNEEARQLGLTYGQYQAMRMKGRWTE